MIYSKVDDIIETMRKEKMPFVRVYNNGNMTFAQDEKIDADTAAVSLENYLNSLEGSGFVEVGLYEKNTDATTKGGNVRPKYKYAVKIGGAAVSASAAITGLSSNREKELRDQLEEARQQIRDMQWLMKLNKMQEDFDKRIAGLEEDEPDTNSWAWLQDIIKPYAPALLAKITGQPLSAPHLNDNVASEGTEEELDDVIDNAVDELIDIYGPATVAQLFAKLAELAKQDKAKLESFFPLIFSMK